MKLRFLAGCALGFALATSVILLLFATFLCGKAVWALLMAPSVSIEIVRAYPGLFQPLLHLLVAEIVLLFLVMGLFNVYRKYMAEGKKKRNPQRTPSEDVF